MDPTGAVVVSLRQTVERVSGTVVLANVGTVPVVSSNSATCSITVKPGELVLLGGWVETNRAPIFTEVDFLEKVPLVGGCVNGYVNRLVTLPKRSTREEIITLLRARLLPIDEGPTSTAGLTSRKSTGLKPRC
jgi:hypothetical protein